MRNIAVVGCGQWGKNLIRNFAELGALRVACDIDLPRLAFIREQFPEVRVTTSFTEVLRDHEVTGLVIAAPASRHAALAKEALLAGKDVFVEKPIALTIAEGKELVELAERHGRILMVGHLLRYHPAVRTLKRLIDDGTLGKLYYIYSNRLNLGRFRIEENILWSFAPHDISTILYLLGEAPTSVAALGGSYLTPGIPDVTVTTLEFRSGVKGHIFVSWLHPYKEQKLIIVGDSQMAIFDDVEPEKKLLLLNHQIEWIDRLPVARMEKAQAVPFPKEEPLQAECRHFLDCIASRRTPDTDGREGLRVLELLEASQESLNGKGAVISLPGSSPKIYFAHETAIIDQPCEIGEGTRIWHFSHIMQRAKIGRDCILGQNVHVGSQVIIGNRCKIQNNVSLYDGVVLEDEVFCGPSAVFTNVINPRSAVQRKHEFKSTLVKQGATIGANATVLCGCTIGRYAFIGAGAVVTKEVPDYALIVGTPGRVVGWMCRCGIKLAFTPTNKLEVEQGQCRHCGMCYVKQQDLVAEASAREGPTR